jgi:O-antigen polymerase
VLAVCAYAGWEYWRVMQLYLPPAERASQWREDPRPAARGLVLFHAPAQFAELTTTALTRANAGAMHAMAQQVIHFSPEPKVIELLIDSAIQVGRPDEALLDMMRFRAAFPAEYAAWRERSGLAPAPSPRP